MLVSKPSAQSDLELIRQYKSSGDLGMVGHLFSRYTSLVFGVCLKYLKDREEAKDAVMHVFEKLVQSLKDRKRTREAKRSFVGEAPQVTSISFFAPEPRCDSYRR